MTDSDEGKAPESGTEDIISNLPRNLIDCILECIPIRDAARTSILSRNWRYIWAMHPHLVLDKQFFDETIKTKEFIEYEFVRIINKILLLHSGPVLKFILDIPDVCFDHCPDIDHWLLYLARNGIKELTLDSSNRNPYKLPSYVFSCSELTYLKLCNCTFRPPLAFRGFHNLISLHFIKIAFEANTVRTLFSSAPLLEKLYLWYCTGIDHFNIHAPKLKGLQVYDSREFKSISFENNPNLTAVSISLCKKVENPGQGKTTNVDKLFGNLQRIGKLSLDGYFVEFLAAGDVPKRFPTTVIHLKWLKFSNLGVNDLDQISCALCLIRSCPNLRELEISAFVIGNSDLEPVLNYLEAPDCMDQMLNHLHAVRIKLTKGLKPELLFVKLLLGCSPLLETMFVEHSAIVDANEALRISRELTRFPRMSPKAEVIY